MTSGPGFRVATPADAATLVDLLMGGALVAGTERPERLGIYAAALERIAADPANDVWVAEADGEVVGLLQLMILQHLQHGGGRCAEIESVHVRADRRGQGIGTALLRHAIELAREAGCYRVQLTSNLARPDAHRWYERMGFVPSHQGFKLPLP